MTPPTSTPLKPGSKKIQPDHCTPQTVVRNSPKDASDASDPQVSVLAQSAKAELTAVYLDRRPALVRFFTSRTGSADRAEDIVQEIYLRLQSLTEEAAEAVKTPAPFLYRIGGNLLLDGVRSTKRTQARDQAWTETATNDVQGMAAADLVSAEDAAWARLKLDRVAKALEGMPANVRTALRLNKVEGLTHGEIAARMGVSRSSVEKYLATAVARLLQEVGWP